MTATAAYVVFFFWLRLQIFDFLLVFGRCEYGNVCERVSGCGGMQSYCYEGGRLLCFLVS